MSNGVPEPFEDRTRRPLARPVLVAITYVVLWGTGAVASIWVDFPALFEVGWALYISILLLVISLIVIVKG